MTTSDHNQWRGSLLRRLSVFGAAGAAVVALMGLLGYVPGLRFLGSVRESYIPMAPSTAISFVVLGGILLAMALRSLSGAILVLSGVLAAIVGIFGALEIAGHLIGKDLNFEHALVPAAGYLGEIPIARMSPSTGALFFLAGLATFTFVLRSAARNRRTYLGHLAGCLGSLVLATSIVFCLAYFYGTPLLYGRGATIPMALTTALGFLMLGIATVCASGSDAIPLKLLAGPSTRACLLRIFLPLTSISTVLGGLVVHRMTMLSDVNPTLVTATAAVLTASITGLVTIWIARHVAIAITRSEAVRDQALASLRDSEHRYRAIAEDTPVLVCRSLPGGEISYVNRAYCKYFGKTPEELVGSSLLATIPEEDREAVTANMSALTVDSPTQSIEHRVIAPDGEIRWQRWTNRALFDAEGTVVAYQAIGEDVTERKRAEEALRESEERFRAMFDSSHDLLSVADANGQTLWANTAWKKVLGYAPEAHGNPLEKVHPEHYRRVTDAYQRLLAGDDAAFTNVEYRYRAADGTYVDLETTLRRRIVSGKTLLYVAAHDITARKRAEEQRLDLERQVQHAQKLESLGVLAGGIAHDFNNLLMAILGNADLALDELSPHAPARENIQEIERAAKRAAELSKQMLAYSGKGRFVVEPIDLGELVEEMTHLLDVSISKKAVLKFNFADNLPTFDGDATQIRQIIMNLITNASEAVGDQSGVVALSTGAMDCDRAYLDTVDNTLRASLEEPLHEGLYVYLEVADTGCGMDAETVQKIFDPFFTTKFTGRGLGMAAALGIVRGHQGAIKIYSELGKGTTFKVLFPANQVPGRSHASPKRDTSEAKAWRGQGTVMIADDEETICAVGKQMLSRMGFNVLTAVDGREVIEIFREHADEIDCVLLDLTMPRMDGEQAFRELRRINPNVKVILCSGYNEQDATQRFVGKGLAGFLQKPYDMATLRKKLTEVLPANDA